MQNVAAAAVKVMITTVAISARPCSRDLKILQKVFHGSVVRFRIYGFWARLFNIRNFYEIISEYPSLKSVSVIGSETISEFPSLR